MKRLATAASILLLTSCGDLLPQILLLNEFTNQPALDGINCWDINGNRIDDIEEDTNGDREWTALDCQGDVGPIGPAGDTGPPGRDGVDGSGHVHPTTGNPHPGRGRN